MTVLVEIALILGLMLLNGALAMSELAMMSSRRGRLEQLAAQGQRGASAALRLVDDPTGFLSTVQVGITLVGILAGAYGGATLGGHLATLLTSFGLAPRLADTVAFTGIVVLVTYLSLIIGELVPKRLALTDPERIACRVAAPLTLVAKLGGPVVWLLRVSTNAVLRLLGIAERREVTVTADEIRSMLAEGARAGVMQPVEHEMIEGVMQIADRSVRSIMTPRVDIVWLHVGDGADEVRRAVAAGNHARYPLCRGELGEVVGVVHLRRLVEALLGGEPLDLFALADPPLMVPERTPVVRLIELFRRHPGQLAVVLDEYGAVEGIATPADLLSAIAGELYEQTAEEPAEAVRRTNGSWLVDGRMAVHRVERLLGRSTLGRADSYTTLAGFILWELGRMPAVGDSFVRDGLRFEVVDLDQRRIDKVLIETVTAAAATS